MDHEQRGENSFHSESSLRLLVISGIRLYRESLADVLAKVPGVGAVSTADDGAGGLARAEEFAPDVVLFDLSLLDGIPALRALSRLLPDAVVLALGIPETEQHVLACVEAGGRSYVPRGASLAELQRVLRHALRGEMLCPPHIAGGLVRRVATLSDGWRAAPAIDRLTDREREILRLISHGHGNRKIAVQLGIQTCTVKNHVHHILEKLEVSSRSDAVTAAHGLVPPPGEPIRSRVGM